MKGNIHLKIQADRLNSNFVSKSILRYLKTDKSARYQGYSFFFREGFCWSDINTTYLKCRLKGKSVNDVKSMSLYGIIATVPESYFVSLINSSFISYYVDSFVNNTQTFQINDARQLPIIIPSASDIKEITDLFNEAVQTKVKLFHNEINQEAAEIVLKKVQNQLDSKVLRIYGI